MYIQLREVEETYQTEEACALALFRAKWPSGFRCPICAHPDYYLIRTRQHPLFECRHCTHQTSLIAGTIMECTRTPLCKWFQAMQLMSLGVSATELMERICVTYKTAWLINHKLRHAMMHANGRVLLAAHIHIQNDMYTGSPYLSSLVPHEKDQPIIAGAEMDDEGKVEKIVMRQVGRGFCRSRFPDRAAGEHFATQHVASNPISVVITPRPSKQYCVALALMCRQAFRWLSATFRGIGAKHLQAYLDEFCYRTNLSAGKRELMDNLPALCAQTITITYRQLTRRKPFSHPAGDFHTPQRIANGRAVA
ncbi:IS1595 family transposase [Cohnella nanjingensis]|uniref:IS1595 family transposase n=1 Tax=Cohnella nanjingensis TaxID=1387779 RepID=A0A7X0RV80_9BACL|nr:IS1595 family transposase [Cohnella nanjingensis]